MRATLSFVMPGLDPGIHVFACGYTWMAGTGPAMTVNVAAEIAET